MPHGLRTLPLYSAISLLGKRVYRTLLLANGDHCDTVIVEVSEHCHFMSLSVCSFLFFSQLMARLSYRKVSKGLDKKQWSEGHIVQCYQWNRIKTWQKDVNKWQRPWTSDSRNRVGGMVPLIDSYKVKLTKQHYSLFQICLFTQPAPLAPTGSQIRYFADRVWQTTQSEIP